MHIKRREKQHHKQKREATEEWEATKEATKTEPLRSRNSLVWKLNNYVVIKRDNSSHTQISFATRIWLCVWC